MLDLPCKHIPVAGGGDSPQTGISQQEYAHRAILARIAAVVGAKQRSASREQRVE